MRVTRQRHGALFLLSRVFLVLVIFVGVVANTAAATPPDVTTIVEQMTTVFEPVRPSLRQMVITVRNDEGDEQMRWVAGVARKQLADGPRTLVVLLKPESLQNNALLIGQRGDQEATLWLSAPALERVRGITPVDAYERFLRTDFTYSDLGFVHRRSAYRFLGEQQHAGVRAYRIEEVPQDQWYYSRILTWVTADSLLPLQREYYDRAGQLWKTEVFDQVTVIDGVPTPLRIRMHDLQQGTMTEVQMSEVRFDVDLPAPLFQPQRLREAVTSPLWQPYRAQVAQNAAANTTTTQ
jgi:outer membrane lipoprotein-sorting protein